jgi:hypothetical protein
MKIISKLYNWIIELRDAKDAGLTNDAGTMRFIMIEHKKNFQHYR